jgi:hypothetical protein
MANSRSAARRMRSRRLGSVAAPAWAWDLDGFFFGEGALMGSGVNVRLIDG